MQINNPFGTSWGDPIATWDYSSSVAAVDFTGLGDYRELMLWYESLTHASAGTTFIGLQLSTDNGATFLATSYLPAGAAATTRLVVTSTIAAATPVMGSVLIQDFNSPTRRCKMQSSGALEASSTVYSRLATRAAGPYNAVRIAPNDGSNYSAGLYRLYGRRG